MPSVKDPQSVSIGSTSLTDVTDIAWSVDAAEIVGPVADAEVYGTIAERGSHTVRGSIAFRNPSSAAAATNLTGTLSATLKAAGQSGSDKSLSISGLSTGGYDANVGHDRTASATVPFIAASSDGTTNPVSLT